MRTRRCIDDILRCCGDFTAGLGLLFVAFSHHFILPPHTTFAVAHLSLPLPLHTVISCFCLLLSTTDRFACIVVWFFFTFLDLSDVTFSHYHRVVVVALSTRFGLYRLRDLPAILHFTTVSFTFYRLGHRSFLPPPPHSTTYCRGCHLRGCCICRALHGSTIAATRLSNYIPRHTRYTFILPTLRLLTLMLPCCLHSLPHTRHVTPYTRRRLPYGITFALRLPLRTVCGYRYTTCRHLRYGFLRKRKKRKRIKGGRKKGKELEGRKEKE